MIIAQKLKMFHKNMKKFVNNKNKYTNDGKMHIASSYIVWYYRLYGIIELGDENERKIISFYAR